MAECSFNTEHEDVVHDARLDYYGERLATCSSDRTIRIFDMKSETSRSVLDVIKGHKDIVWQLSWSHPIFDNLLASASQDGTVRIWQEIGNRSSWIQAYEYKQQNASFCTIEFAPYQHGLMLASGCSNGSILILQKDHSIVQGTDWQSCVINDAHDMGVNSVSWGPSSKKSFVSGGSDGSIKIWVFADNEWTLNATLIGHKDCIREVSWNPSMLSNQIASCSQDMNVIIWQCGDKNWSEKDRIKMDMVPWTVCWCVLGITLIVSCQDNRVRYFKEMASGNFTETSTCVTMKNSDFNQSTNEV